MATKSNETALYVRNARPNRVVIKFAGNRYVLERRGSREDSTALPVEAANDTVVRRWLENKVLEKVSQDDFMQLAARTVDTEPRFFLKTAVRTKGTVGTLGLNPAEADATRSLTQINDKDVIVAADPRLQWAGELMSTKEELAQLDMEAAEQGGYQSKHRGEDTRPRGY
jgi:hypothetical protein